MIASTVQRAFGGHHGRGGFRHHIELIEYWTAY